MLGAFDGMNNKEKVFVLGMARSGYEAAKLLINDGYEVVINDNKTDQDINHINELKSMGATIILGDHPDDLFNDEFVMLVKNPGVPNNHKYVMKANEYNIPIINELELGYRHFLDGVAVVGITGTNGKTTTTTIIHEMLKKTMDRVFLMGNIGYPICSFVSELKKGDIAIMEVSDHQLCNVDRFKTNISVMTNLAEAHLDFHETYDNYKNVKKRIFNHHTNDDVAILNLDNQAVLDLTTDISSVKKYFSSHSTNKLGCSIRDDYIYYNDDKVIALKDIKIKGMHNYENIMAAIMVVKEFGVANDVIVNFLTTFGGVEHRIEYVRTLNGREFYNDSKATNVTSTQTALSSFVNPTILIMGGLDRGHSFEDLKFNLKNVKKIVSYGETKKRIAEFAKSYNIPCEITEDLNAATNKAYDLSDGGDVILLSPACASWDQFKDYEVRGNMFKEYVNKL